MEVNYEVMSKDLEAEQARGCSPLLGQLTYEEK